MELLTPALTKVVGRLAVASVLLFVCGMVAFYGDSWGIGHSYPLLSPYHRAMVIMAILLAALTFLYRLPRYFLLALVLINLVWLLGPLVTFGTLSPLEPLLPRALICSIIAMLAVGYYSSVLAVETHGALPQKIAFLRFLPHLAPLRYPEIVQCIKHWRKILRKRNRLIPWGKRLFCQTAAQRQRACVMVVGPSQSGKTAALLNAELVWALPCQQQEARQPFAATDHPQFWLADNALWCDTPGRFFDPEQWTSETADEWQAFVNHLATLKPEASLEAIVFVMDCPRLFSSTPQQLTEYAALCRTHLEEFPQWREGRLPLYLLVSQLDQLVGFREYFYDIPMKERYQLLGETFTQEEHKSSACLEVISQQLASMVERIAQQVLTKQYQSEDVVIRKGIERFPANVEALTRALVIFIEPLIASRSEVTTEHIPGLQGIYLGCGDLSSEGQFSHPQSLVRQWLKETSRAEAGGTVSPPNAILDNLPRSFRHFFIKTLFQQRIIDDYRLRHGSQAKQFTTRFRRGVILTAILAVGSISLYSLTQRYDNDQRLLTESRHALNRLDEELSATQPPLDLALTQLSQLVPSIPPYPALSSPSGLGMAEKWAEVNNRVYHQWLKDHLLPMVENVTVEDLSAQLAESDPQRLLTILSVYLMLHGELERDNALLERWFSSHAELLSAFERQDSAPLLVRRLFRETNWQISRQSADHQLIDAARQRLLQQPLPIYLYQYIIQQVSDVSLPLVALPQLITSSEPLLFISQPASKPAAGLYNLQGVQYWDTHVATTVFPKALARVEKILYGKTPIPREYTPQQRWQQVSRLYLQGYRQYWQDFLQGLQLNLSVAGHEAKPGQQRHRIEYLLKDFTRQDSQLRQLLVNVALQTQLATALGDAAYPAEIIEEERQRRRDNVDHHFIALHRFVDAPDANTAFSLAQLEMALTQLYITLQATEMTTDNQFNALLSEQAKVSQGGSTILRHIDQLPQPLPRLFVPLLSVAQQQVAQHTWTMNAEQINQEIIRYCRQHLMGRYPFALSAVEADPHTVAEMFSPQGKLARYFSEHLADKVDTHHRPWRFITADHAISPRLLTLFEQGKQIQQQLFPQASQSSGLTLMLSVQDMTNGITQLIIDNDDQQFRYVHGPILQQKLRWPAIHPAVTFQIRAVAAEGHSLWSIEEKGYWGILRWLERSQKQFEPRSRQTIVTLGKDGAQARLAVNGLETSVPHLISLFRRIDCSLAE